MAKTSEEMITPKQVIWPNGVARNSSSKEGGFCSMRCASLVLIRASPMAGKSSRARNAIFIVFLGCAKARRSRERIKTSSRNGTSRVMPMTLTLKER